MKLKLEDLTSKLKKKYVFMEDTMQILHIAKETNNNVILFGRGGNGKSELTLDFFNEYGITPFVLTMGSGMSPDRLFGGINVKEINDTGKIEYLVENSWMNHEYVVFEEMMDAPDFVLEQLKDIISSGIFRNGTQTFPIKTKLIVCCTNRTREEFAKNLSLKALMERFPLELLVEWKDYNRTTYEHLLNTVLGKADPMLVYLLDKLANVEKHIISPRIAIKSAKLIETCGPECLRFIAEFGSKIDKVRKHVRAFEDYFKLVEIKEKVNLSIKAINETTDKVADGKENKETLTKELENLKKMVNTLKRMKLADDILEDWKNIKNNAEREYTKAQSILKSIETLENGLL